MHICDPTVTHTVHPIGSGRYSMYVDDMLIVGSNDKMIISTKNILNSRFDIKDMRPIDVILGIKLIRTSDKLILS